MLTRTQGLLHSGIRLTHRQRRPEVQSQTSSPIRSLSTPTGYAAITTRAGIKDATCRSVRLAGQDTSTTQKPTSRHVLSRTQRLLHSAVNSHSSACTHSAVCIARGATGSTLSYRQSVTLLSLHSPSITSGKPHHQAERDSQEHHPSERVVFRQKNDARGSTRFDSMNATWINVVFGLKNSREYV